jgi:2-polyprenyl-3-methyl-5-hydroxy-6-metoxy-1,4-benzoquinol methylase
VQHWYVYYKLPRAEREVSIARVRQMQQDVARASTVRMLLLERAEESKQHDTMTMMEVYEDIEQPEHFAAVLDAAVRRSGLSAVLVAARRVERFEDV